MWGCTLGRCGFNPYLWVNNAMSLEFPGRVRFVLGSILGVGRASLLAI